MRIQDPAKQDPAIVVFSGGPGVGKTHLIESIRNGLSTSGIDYDYFSGKVPSTLLGPKIDSPIVVGDDAFSQFDQISGKSGRAPWSEVESLNNTVMDSWYPKGSLVVMSSNFSLNAIQRALSEFDTIGRVSSRLEEMAQRGADVPIEGRDHRVSGGVKSIF